MSDKVVRHPLTVRVVHWVIVVSGVVLLLSGLGEMPIYKRFMVADLPGLGWTANYELQLVIHYLAAIPFSFAVIYHIVWHTRRREFEAMPKKGDLHESLEIVKAMVTGKEEPPHGKFLAEQRLAYVALGGTLLMLVVTGIVKTLKNTGPEFMLHPTFSVWVTMSHNFFAGAFIFLVIAHLGAFVLKANWPLLPTMFTGKVDADYARRRHPLWKPDEE